MGLKKDGAPAIKLALATGIAAETAAGTAVEVGEAVAETAAPRSHHGIETAKTAIAEARAKAAAIEETPRPPIKKILSSSLV